MQSYEKLFIPPNGGGPQAQFFRPVAENNHLATVNQGVTTPELLAYGTEDNGLCGASN